MVLLRKDVGLSGTHLPKRRGLAVGDMNLVCQMESSNGFMAALRVWGREEGREGERGERGRESYVTP